MFRRENMRWTIPVLAVVVVAGMALAFVWRPGGTAVAQTKPAALGVSEIIAAMQSRADRLPGLSGVLGTRETVPQEGAWSGVPFLYRGPDAFVRQDGYPMTSPDETPSMQENAWLVFKDGYLYVQERLGQKWSWSESEKKMVAAGPGDPFPAVMVRPGYSFKGRSYGRDATALLLVNLMPEEWFKPSLRDLQAGPIEEVDGKWYYTVMDLEEPAYISGIPLRFPHLWQWRSQVKYYVNAQSYACERMVWGDGRLREAFAKPKLEVIGTDVETVGGAALPMTYTLRTLGAAGVTHAERMTLQNVAVKEAGTIADSQVSPAALSGSVAAIMRPLATPDDLLEVVRQDPSDAGAWLSLAYVYNLIRDYMKADEAYQRAEELIAGRECGGMTWLAASVQPTLAQKATQYTVRQEKQLERIYAERAERFRGLGDAKKAGQMDGRAAEHRQAKESALARAQQLGVRIEN